jgi:phosphoribosylanthranilate isomerase
MRIRVKICGITRQADADAAVVAGADALGFNFYRESPRVIAPDEAAAIIERLPPFVTTVGLFVDPAPDELAAVLEAVPVHVAQFHGDEPEALCAGAGRPYVKAFNMAPDFDVEAAIDRYPTAAGFLLDGYAPGQRGGTGETFDWRRWPRQCRKPLILAGGLTVANVADAIVRTRPYAVDVSGGVEGPVKGRKDADMLRQFINEVSRADRFQPNRQ